MTNPTFDLGFDPTKTISSVWNTIKVRTTDILTRAFKTAAEVAAVAFGAAGFDVFSLSSWKAAVITVGSAVAAVVVNGVKAAFEGRALASEAREVFPTH